METVNLPLEWAGAVIKQGKEETERTQHGSCEGRISHLQDCWSSPLDNVASLYQSSAENGRLVFLFVSNSCFRALQKKDG
ncbi:hypothetical protein J6590_062371 [Homalodisca vitripennis]|nr:hypothetical protein J6590_062371 [Homalodisca vitripennis]